MNMFSVPKYTINKGSWWDLGECVSIKKILVYIVWDPLFWRWRTVLVVSTWVLVTWGGAILLLSAPTWIRGERQLLDTTGQDLVVSCTSLLSSLIFSTCIPHLSFLGLVLLVLIVFFVSWLGCFICLSVIFAKETLATVLSLVEKNLFRCGNTSWYAKVYFLL
jgi:hypothetical protein